MKFLKKIFGKYLTDSVQTREITETRDTNGSENRETRLPAPEGAADGGQVKGQGDVLSKDRTMPAAGRLILESFHCPYCGSTKFVRRGFRQKKREKIQLYLCSSCQKTFTPYSTKGKRYPMAVVIDALSIYNLGYSLEQTCRIVSQRTSTVIPVKTGIHLDPRIPARNATHSVAGGREDDKRRALGVA